MADGTVCGGRAAPDRQPRLVEPVDAIAGAGTDCLSAGRTDRRAGRCVMCPEQDYTEHCYACA
ncbi:hypothetical protein D3C80_1783780 [compost metagenome]